MNKKIEENEILETLKSKLVKGESVSSLCKELDIDEFKLFGYIRKLKDLNMNITMSNKSGDMFLIINHTPDYTKENVYSIKIKMNLLK